MIEAIGARKQNQQQFEAQLHGAKIKGGKQEHHRGEDLFGGKHGKINLGSVKPY